MYNIIHLIVLAIIGKNTVINSIILLLVARSSSVIEVQLSSTVNGKTYTIMLADCKLNLAILEVLIIVFLFLGWT